MGARRGEVLSNADAHGLALRAVNSPCGYGDSVRRARWVSVSLVTVNRMYVVRGPRSCGRDRCQGRGRREKFDIASALAARRVSTRSIVASRPSLARRAGTVNRDVTCTTTLRNCDGFRLTQP